MNITENLMSMNTWWVTNEIPKELVPQNKRKEFDDIIYLLKERRITSLIGPRRVGKSTLIYQVIDYLLNVQKVNAHRILMFNGDDPSLFLTQENTLSKVIDTYFSNILFEDIRNLKEKVYIFIDEIHFIDKWQKYLKLYYDKKYNLKFIITGSSATHLFRDSNESLLGRIESIYILPLDFEQFVNFYKIYVKSDVNNNIPKIDFNNIEKSFEELENIYYDKTTCMELQKILSLYMLVGGYPEYFENSNNILWQRRLIEDIIQKGIYKDILEVYSIKSPEVLEKLMYYISANDSQMFSYSNISKILGIDTTTVINYLTYLKQAFLINVVDNYSSNIGKIVRANKKLSILDNGIRNGLLKRLEVRLDEEGLLVESMVNFNIRNISQKENYDFFYYRRDKEEIDIVLDRKVDIVPIEVKYRNEIKDNMFETIKRFISDNANNKYNRCSYGIVVTKDIYKKEGNIYYIPYYLFRV